MQCTFCQLFSLRILAECARILQRGCHRGRAKSTLITTCDLAVGDFAIECLGVHATENLDVRVATIFVKVMKGRRLRPVSFPILNCPVQFCSQCFIEWSLPYSLPFFGIKEFCRPCYSRYGHEHTIAQVSNNVSKSLSVHAS